jgi:hypothetical protein
MTLRDLMRRVLDEPEVAAAMRAKGYARPNMYQWDSTAAALMRGLQDLEWVAGRSTDALSTNERTSFTIGTPLIAARKKYLSKLLTTFAGR